MAPNGGYSHHLGMGAPGYANNSNGNGNFKAAPGPPPGIISPPGFSSGNNYARSSQQEEGQEARGGQGEVGAGVAAVPALQEQDDPVAEVHDEHVLLSTTPNPV